MEKEKKNQMMVMMNDALVKLCPKEIVDELTWGLILLARCLILEYEIWGVATVLSPVHISVSDGD